jgi:hypothetical protein
MQTFTDFITKRFGLNENDDINQQLVPNKMIKKIKDLKNVIHIILENPNYFDEFFKSIKEFVENVKDNDLHNMIADLEHNMRQDDKDKGLGLLDGESHKPNNLPPNMGG